MTELTHTPKELFDLRLKIAAALLGGSYSDFRSRDDAAQDMLIHTALDDAELLVDIAMARAGVERPEDDPVQSSRD